MPLRCPVDEQRFVLEHVVGIHELTNDADIVDALLEGAAQYAEGEVEPLNRVGVYATQPPVPQFEQVAVNLLDANESNTIPMSDPPALIRSVVDKLWPMGDDTVFIPGHGPVGTFGRERASNPFVGDRVLKRA